MNRSEIVSRISRLKALIDQRDQALQADEKGYLKGEVIVKGILSRERREKYQEDIKIFERELIALQLDLTEKDKEPKKKKKILQR